MKYKLNNIKAIYTWSNISKKVIKLVNKEILISNGKIILINDKIDYNENIIDAENYVITPGFIDSHTHPIFIGNRATEFDMRCSGSSYQQIAKNGGGIFSTVKTLRDATSDELYWATRNNILRLVHNGATTIEAKSGYGLSVHDEIKSLEVIKKLNNDLPVTIIPTFMGAHAFPDEFINNSNDYVDLICKEMIPEIKDKGLAKFCDIFCEKGYFSIEQSRTILSSAIDAGMKIKMHADEFHDLGAIDLAIEINANSVDHLMFSSEDSMKKLGKSTIIATLLPGTSLFLGGKRYANGRKMIDLGCNIALATDYNPGSCTITSLPMILFLSMINCGLTIEESFKGVTYNAAKSLSIEDEVGVVSKNYNADLLFWDIDSLAEIPYWMNNDRLKKVMKDGKFID